MLGRKKPGDLFDRVTQDDLLQLRNDLMTVYREIDSARPELFPLRYARTTPRRRREHPRSGTSGARPVGPPTPAPQVPVLLLPDGPSRASVLPYDVLRRSLAGRGLDVIMMEHRGVGFSRLDDRGQDLPLEAIRLEEALQDLLAVLDHARAEQVAVVGTGYGAYLAQLLAALHPERVHSLVLDSPLTSASDEAIAQRALRALYWEGTEPATAPTARALRRLAEDGTVDIERAGAVVLAVHEHGGTEAVADLVDLLAHGRGGLAWSSVRQVLTQGWLQSTPFIAEFDLTSRLLHTQLGSGAHADGGPLDPLMLAAQQARAVPDFRGEPYDLHELSRRITAPTLVLSGSRDLISPPVIARQLASRIPGAQLIQIPGAGHSLLDTRSRILQVAVRWSACGRGHLLPERAAELADLPASPTDLALTRGLQLALAAERYSPWRLRWESARARREREHRERALTSPRPARRLDAIDPREAV